MAEGETQGMHSAGVRAAVVITEVEAVESLKHECQAEELRQDVSMGPLGLDGVHPRAEPGQRGAAIVYSSSNAAVPSRGSFVRVRNDVDDLSDDTTSMTNDVEDR
ncbi:MAG: hypothetical protein ACKPKO_57430, partial [Candidatus Fonsibacter sp.]